MILFCSPIGLHYLCNNEKDRFHPNRQRGALLVTGMVCFVAAYVITNPWIKNSLLLAGLAAVVISVGLYITAWKHE